MHADESVARILGLLAQGLTHLAISQEVGVSKSFVWAVASGRRGLWVEQRAEAKRLQGGRPRHGLVRRRCGCGRLMWMPADAERCWACEVEAYPRKPGPGDTREHGPLRLELPNDRGTRERYERCRARAALRLELGAEFRGCEEATAEAVLRLRAEGCSYSTISKLSGVGCKLVKKIVRYYRPLTAVGESSDQSAAD